MVFYTERSLSIIEDMMETFAIKKYDGKKIIATRFPAKKTLRRSLIIAAATGVKQTFYYKFAAFCSEMGYDVYTFDYSGIGLSDGKRVKESTASYSTWGKEDMPAVVEYVKKAHSDQPLYYIGHSFGGNCLGMSEAALECDAIVTIGSQHGYLAHFDIWRIPLVWFVFSISMPLLTKLYGYFPSATHSLGENLPKNVASDWSKVILNKNGMEIIAGDSWRRELRTNMLVLSFDDDSFAPQRAVDQCAYVSYSGTVVVRRHIKPKEIGVAAIGHFDFFRPKFQDSLWHSVIAWLEVQGKEQTMSA